MGYFVTFIKSEHAGNCAHYWTYRDVTHHFSQRDSLRGALRDIRKDGCLRDYRCIIHLKERKQNNEDVD